VPARGSSRVRRLRRSFPRLDSQLANAGLQCGLRVDGSMSLSTWKALHLQWPLRQGENPFAVTRVGIWKFAGEGFSGCRFYGAAARHGRPGKAEHGRRRQRRRGVHRSKAHQTVFLEFGTGALHLDVLIGGKLLADAIVGIGAGFDVLAPSDIQRTFQILAKTAMHGWLHSRFRGAGSRTRCLMSQKTSGKCGEDLSAQGFSTAWNLQPGGRACLIGRAKVAICRRGIARWSSREPARQPGIRLTLTRSRENLSGRRARE